MNFTVTATNLGRELRVPEAIDDVIVDHADSLHVRIDSRGAHETEAAKLEVFAERIGLRRGCWYLAHGFPLILPRPAFYKSPAVCIETSELFLNCEKCPRVPNRRLDFHAIPDDLRIQRKRLNAFGGVSCHFRRI